MDITPLISEGTKIIQGYGNGGFKINGEAVKGNLIVSPSFVWRWEISTIEQITLESLEPLIQEKSTSILLIGCGTQLIRIAPELKASLKALGIAVDVMDTGAACRTYNVLLSEGRNVAAAVIAVA